MNHLRKSSLNDYVAVDVINAETKILETPIYLAKGKAVSLYSYDVEEKRYMKTRVKFNGTLLQCTDSTGFYWESSVDELIENYNGRPLFKANK